MPHRNHEIEWSDKSVTSEGWSYLRPYCIAIASWAASLLLVWLTGAPAICLLLGVVVGCLFTDRYANILSIGLSIIAFSLFQATNWRLTTSQIATPRVATFTFATLFICYVIRSREESSQNSAHELRELLDSLPHQIFLLDPDGYVLKANKSVVDFTGLSQKELKNIDIEARPSIDIDLDARLAFRNSYEQRLKEGKTFEIERRARGRNGELRWFLFRYKPIHNRLGQVTQWICTATDIEQTKQTDERLRLVVDTTPAYIHSALPDGRVDYLNQRWLDYIGLPLEAALARELLPEDDAPLQARAVNLRRSVHPEDLDLFTKRWRSIVSSGEATTFEVRIRRFDGAFRWFLFQPAPLCDASGKITKWYVASIDIDDYKRSKDELRRKDAEVTEQLRIAIDTTPFLAWIARSDGPADFLNKRWLEYSGLSLDEALDWKFLSAIHPEDIASINEIFSNALVNRDFFEAEARIRRFDGEYRWFLFRACPFLDDSGEVVRWFGANVDIEDRKRTEEALRTSEQSLRLVVDMTPGLVHTMNPSGELENVSQKEIDYFGKTFDELRNWSALVHPDDLDWVLRYHEQRLKTGEPYDAEIRLLRSDGSYRWMHVLGVAQRNNAGDVIRWYFHMADEEERHQAADEIKRRERYLVEGQRMSRTASFSWRMPDKKLSFLSEEGYRIFGFDLDKSLPNWQERVSYVHPEDLQRWQQVVDEAIEQKSDYEMEYRIIHPSGAIKWLRIVGHAAFDNHGELVEYVGTVIDITEQRNAEESMLETERNLRQIIETVPALVWSATANGNTIFANQQYLKYAGIASEDFRGLNWLSLIHPDDEHETNNSWLQSLESGRRHERNHRIRRADGVYRWFQTIAEPLRDNKGRISQWFGLNIDIDDSRNMAEALRATQTRLSSATQIATVAELSASIAHEINQPLGALVANATACEMWLTADTPNIERARVAIQRIARDGNAAAEVIQRIRDLFKRARPNKTLLNMSEVISEVLELLSGELQAKRISVETSLAPDLPVVMADRFQMQQLIANLVHNAIESMDAVPESRKVLRINSCLDSHSGLLIEVSDRGVGLSEPERIFDPFFTTKEKGMGIGLSISKTISDAHGGKLRATLNKEEGTTFSFTLPMASKQ